jgi:subtilisin family serine protease
MKRNLFWCGVTIAVAGSVLAGEVHPGLRDYMAGKPADESISALIFLSNQVDIAGLNASLNAQHARRVDRHEAVVTSLQDNARNTQGALIGQLNTLQRAGRIKSFHAFWIANVIQVKATAAEIEELARRADVGTIYLDYEIELVDPDVVGTMTGAPVSADGRTPEPGLVAIHAPEAWGLGYTGEGILVATLDTGVDGTHPALASRWRGLDPAYAGHPEWAFFDPVTSWTEPHDSGAHGTHTMGTVCGGAPGNQVGVAPGAQWIHAAVIDRVDIPTTVADAILAFQWLIDPDGDPFTNWDVPAVCSNSWGVTTGHGYAPCDDTFWSYIDACEAAGIVVLFSAGNEGYMGAETLRRPADRATDEYRSTAVGGINASVDPEPPFEMYDDSSRGPSHCTPTGEEAIKPEISAPGVNVVSSLPGADYGPMTGTSMASPHVNGVVALVRQACPDLTVEEVKQVLYDTALDQGEPGKDNNYGYGVVDAYAAVLRAIALCISSAGTVELDAVKYACASTVSIDVADLDLNQDPEAAETVDVTIESDTQPGGMTVTLTETTPDSSRFRGTVEVSATAGPGVLQVSDGDTLTATYIDADDGLGHQDVVVTATAPIDCTPPVITNVQAVDIEPRAARITCTTDEPARLTVHYGLDCEFLDQTASSAGFSTAPFARLQGLEDDTTYYYTVEAVDQAGNTGIDDNCYSFTTPEVPDFFTEVFGSGDPNDLDNLSLLFEPNGSNDFYFGCVENISELPTDPEGGTALSISEDQYVQVTVTGGHAVSLYGTEYSSFWVSDNGYITFGAGDGEWTETPEAHFDLPRISALFDDFSVDDGGDVSYKQLDDRIVVTYLHVPEYNTTDSNTFQVEMYFDGRITISYLQLDATDGLAGLSQGDGLSPDFLPTDLSAMGACYAVNLSLPYGSPELLSTDEPTTVSVRIRNGRETYVPDSGTVYYSYDGGAYESAPLAQVSGEMFEALLPLAVCGDTPRFYFSATGSGGTTVYLPQAGAADPLRAGVGTVLTLLDDNFESDLGWTVWNDASLTSGAWERAVPASPASLGAPPADFDGSGQCYLTDNIPNYDVDGGPTILTSPALDARNGGELILSYARWFFCDDVLPPAQDYFDVEVSNDDGATWTLVQRYTSQEAWVQESLRLSDYVAPTAHTRVRFSTMDRPNNSQTEAAIDAVQVVEVYCQVAAEPGDLNCDGVVNGYDIDAFVLALTSAPSFVAYHAAYPNCDAMLADVNCDGTVNGYDIDPFVECLTEGGCAPCP